MLKYFFAILPVFIIVLLFYINDKEKDKRKKIIYILLLLFGMLGSYITYRVENKVGSYFPEMTDMNYLFAFIYSIFGVAIWEEGVKLFFLFLFTYKEKFKKKFSWISLSVVSSMGYALFENIVFYVMKGNIYTAIGRMFTSIPSHAFFGVIMGVNFFQYKKTGKLRYLFLSLIIPTLVHALYNLPLYKNYFRASEFCTIYLTLLCIYCVNIFIKYRNK